MHRFRKQGMTLVEMLIAMAILGIVLLLTSSGIIQALQVNRLAQDSTNTQAKLRRITEVVSQELRSAVLGGITHMPITSTSTSISFALLSGDGGLPVTDIGISSWQGSTTTSVYASDADALDHLIGEPAIAINSAGMAVIIPEVQRSSVANQVSHPDCTIPIHFTPNSRLYSARALGFRFDPDQETLYQITVDGDGETTEAFAFGLSRFEISYEYAAADDLIYRNAPWDDSNGMPQPFFELSGDVYDLVRLRVSLASSADTDSVEREYVSYIDLTGIGNDREAPRIVTELYTCGSGGTPGGGDPGGGDDDGDDPGGGDDGGGDPGGGDDGGGGPGGGGDDNNDDDDDEDCGKRGNRC